MHLDINNQKDQRILASAFIDQSACDIKNHFQTVSNWSSLEIPELWQIVNFIYGQRKKERGRKWGGAEKGIGNEGEGLKGKRI